ncbi:MAG: hypothetical protein V3U19_09745 [Thermodesulfobacteriota bacterium]|jgi:hypothetical protein|nr:hypothetical protein [Candidatus Dadabacteria bacterium]MCZ6864695.1 hypothetical protein [Candidatus Dadabacteria bacterium]
MKATKLIDTILKLVKLADKEYYYNNHNLQLRFSSEDSTFVIGTKENGTIYLSVYFGFEIDFKFYLEKDGTVLLDEGSAATLIEYYGPEYVINLINNAGEALLIFGTGAIESGNYEFKTMEQVTEEFRQIRNPVKEKSEKH